MRRRRRVVIQASIHLIECMFFLLLTGCFVVVRNPMTNHSIWQTRLPKEPDYKGGVFILQAPPTADFAFLLAQKYPESFVVCCSNTAWTSVYRQEEKELNDLRYILTPGNVILRRESWARPRVAIPVTSVILEKILIFHRMKIVSCGQLPPAFTNAPCINCSWSEETRKLDLRPKSDGNIFMEEIEPCISGFSSLLSMIAIPVSPVMPPLPLGNPNSEYGWSRQDLDVLINSRQKEHFVSRENADSGFSAGYIWLLPLALLTGDTPGSLWDIPFSPGGWADCLEQMFQSPAVIRFGQATGGLSSQALEKEFERMYQTEGYDLDKRFSLSSKPDICYLKSHQKPQAPVYVWCKFENGKNWLLPVLRPLDKVVTGSR